MKPNFTLHSVFDKPAANGSKETAHLFKPELFWHEPKDERKARAQPELPPNANPRDGIADFLKQRHFLRVEGVVIPDLWDSSDYLNGRPALME